MTDLTGRVALVTGGGRGLGFAAAEVLVSEGARVILSAPDEVSVAAAAARLTQDAAAANSVAGLALNGLSPPAGRTSAEAPARRPPRRM